MVLVNYTSLFIVLFCAFRATGEASPFRILAPEIICPTDENAVIEKPNYIVITLQTEADDLKFAWTVRWAHLEASTQRFTLLLWRTVRTLESQLNGPQPDPYAFVINNTQLLGGVDYIFNITSTSETDHNGSTKSFHIDNIKGDQKLIVDGRSDKLSVFLVGGVKTFTDLEYTLVAEVTTCTSVYDYYFAWNVVEASGNIINVDDISGWKLKIPPYSLRAGENYYVTCQVFRNSSLVTQTEMTFQVLYRELKVYLNVDLLFVTKNNAFTIEAIVENHDFLEEAPMLKWSCVHQDEPCLNFESSESETLIIPTGFSEIGQYEITLLVSTQAQRASVNATVTVVEPILPIIQIQPLNRLLNDGTKVFLIANASNVAPTCTLTWYFATQEHLASFSEKEECDDCQHGEALSDSLTIFSLEENFLNEIADFTNETEWRQVTAEMEATEGRARFVAECGCSLTFSCRTEGLVYADIHFQLNPGPIVADIKITPEGGIAMETVFRISKISASDSEKPLLYSLLCSLGEETTLVLGTNLDHLTVDTFLPFVDDSGTNIWAEVCDSLGACSSSNVMTIQLSSGKARSQQLLVDDMRGFVLRCEVMLLNQVVRSAVVTYLNANQQEALADFTRDILETLPAEDHCLKQHQEYWVMLHWLASQGIDTSALE